MKFSCIILTGSIPLSSPDTNDSRYLSSLYQDSKNINMSNSLSGIFSYALGRFYLILEGAEENVSYIKETSPYHELQNDITILCETTDTETYFSTATLKIAHKLIRNKEFSDYCNAHTSTLCESSPEQKEILETICTIDLDNPAPAEVRRSTRSIAAKELTKPKFAAPAPAQQASPAVPSKNYAGKGLKLLSWPDFTVVQAKAANIEICATLIKSVKPIAYEVLLEQSQYSNEEEINTLLTTLDELQLLKVSDSKTNEVVTAKTIEKPESKKRFSFYSKVKKFLNRKK